MKRLVWLVGFLLLVGRLSASEDFTGKWSGSFTGTGPDGTQVTERFVLNLVHKGVELTGTAGPSDAVQWKIAKGKANANSIAFEVQGGGDTQGGPLLKFTLALVEGQLKGDVIGERGDQKLTAKATADRVK